MKSVSSEQSIVSEYTSELASRNWLSEKTFELELTRPPSFEFTSGQRIRLIWKSTEREYSLTSAPADPSLGLCVRRVGGGELSPILASAKVGKRFHFTGPYGYFTFRASSRQAVFVATGTGIAPFVSMGRSGVSGFTLLHGVQTGEDLYYESLFRPIAKRYVPCVSGVSDVSPPVPGTFRGRVTEYLEKHFPVGSYDFYLCGRREMIRDVTLLVDELFPDSIVHTEVFY